MTQNREPLVSIIIPVYNGSKFMQEAIDSALAQTYSNIEVIVVNDGSKDNGATERIALSYGKRIRYISKENGGVSSALNKGIENMHGEYFSWLSHDDKYLPDKIKTQMEVINRLEDKKTLAICGTKEINVKSEDILSAKKGNAKWMEFDIGQNINWKIALKDVIHNGSFSGCALLIPKAAFLVTGYFDETLRYCQDFLMWIQMFLNEYSLVRTPGVHVCSRVHDGQLTQTGKAVFHNDSILMGNLLFEPLAEKSTKEYNFVKSFAIYNAIYNNPTVVDKFIEAGSRKGLLTAFDKLQIRGIELYGKVRPCIRKLYYRLVRNMKTQ